MTDVYSNCPAFENAKYMLRFVEEQDADDLLEVYSDKNALPFFNSDNCDGVLRLDVGSAYEKESVLYHIMSLIVPPAFELFDCNEIITKVPNYAVERIRAVQRFGFTKSEEFLIGTHDRYAYNGYWKIQK